MKTLIITICLFALAAGMSAQVSKGYYYKADSLTATGVTSAAKRTRGYDTYLRCGTNAAIYGTFAQKDLAIEFTKDTDSVKVQAGYFDYGTAGYWSAGLSYFLETGTATTAGKVDTFWVDLQLTPRFQKSASAFTAGGYLPQRDTTQTWFSPVSTDQMKWVLNLDQCYAPVLRVVSGLNDSGKTYIIDARRGGY